MARRQTEIMRGTLHLLVLKTLALEPQHGVGVADRIAQITRGTFQVGPGSLFPVLHRRVHLGGVEPDARGPTREVLPVDRGGRAEASAEKKQWARVALAIGQILEAD
jgi:DNA-binding PadR family transcriptional regulator